MVKIEQRMSLRYKAPAKTIVYTSESFGQILDICDDGFAMQYIDLGTPVRQQEVVDIFMGSLCLSLRKIPVTVVWENHSPLPKNNSAIMSTVGVKFDNLTEVQRAMLDYFICHHSAGNA